MPDAAPLVLTLALDPADQEHLDRLRREHFPPERNHLGAHVTLFHALPGEHLDEVRAELAVATRRSPLDVPVTGVRSLGRGVAYDLASPDVTALRRRLARAWEPWLTRQDAQWSRPHVTVQNKVAPEQARALHAQLSAAFVPWSVRAVGLDLWHYRGGPWEPAARYPFAP